MNYGQYDNVKLYYSISEVCQKVEVEKHVLRYWEKEFSQLKPKKRSNQRIYTEKDIELITRIKHLLYTEKFTIEGARLQLKKKKDLEVKNQEIEEIKSENSMQEIPVFNMSGRSKADIEDLKETMRLQTVMKFEEEKSQAKADSNVNKEKINKMLNQIKDIKKMLNDD